jgi:hypothetical protein
VFSLATAACLWALPAVTSAQEAPASLPAALSVDDIHSRFAQSGYLVGEAHTWAWAQPPFTSFRVSDAASDRVLAVVVYPSTEATNVARAEAGQYPVTGFGPALWSGNVALAESNDELLTRQTDAMFDTRTPTPPPIAVDFDFQQALVHGATHL